MDVFEKFPLNFIRLRKMFGATGRTSVSGVKPSLTEGSDVNATFEIF